MKSERYTVESNRETLNGEELFYNNVFIRNGNIFYRDRKREWRLLDFIRVFNQASGGGALPEDDQELEALLLKNAWSGVRTKEGMLAFVYRILRAKADLWKRLKAYEDTGECPEVLESAKTQAAELIEYMTDMLERAGRSQV